MEIEQATPEQQANLDGMSIEQLETMVSQEEGAAPVEGEQATAQNQGESVGKTETQTPSADEPPKYFKDFAENIRRELGSFRSLASLKDQIPQMVQKEAQRQLAELRQAQNNANLSPEDQQAQAQLQTQQEEWAKFVREQAKAEFGDAAKEYLPLLQELKEQKADSSHRMASLELVKDVIPENADKAWEELFEGSYKDITAGKPGAVERFERLEKDPSYVALELIKLQRGKVQSQATQVSDQRDKMARAAAQTPKPSGNNANAGKKAVNEMSQAELDKLSTAELEAAIPEM